MSVATFKVRLYDLAKELKIDTKRLIEDVRREGVDVSVPSNQISKELAEKLREKYAVKKDSSFRQVRVLRPTAAALRAGTRPGESTPAPPPAGTVIPAPAVDERIVQVDAQKLESYWNRQKPLEESSAIAGPRRSKVRLYDLAKELKIDTKRLIQEVRREGVDVSVPSNSISKELAAEIRDKYFPKNSTVAKRAVKVVTKAARPVVEEAPAMEESPVIAEPPPDEVIDEPQVIEPEHSADDSSEKDLLELLIDPSDDVLRQVNKLVGDYAGVILIGPPGTSKTWYARQIAAALTDRDKKRVRFVQFHQSYQYEDFVEGYVPREDGNGFQLRSKHLMEMCEVAERLNGKTCVMIIDELSRSDPGRVFGEALTYIEPTLRGVEFYLASGNPAKIPRNLFFLATMNPLDRGVDEVDAALDRRFAKIAMDPSPERLVTLLTENGASESLKNSIVRFFRFLLRNRNERCRVGHAYFRAIKTESDLQRLWDHQLRFHMERAFQIDRESFRNVEDEWKKTIRASREPRW